MKKAEEIKPNYGPIYAAAMYPELCKIFQKHGYALAVHGSLARDFDLIAIPWTKTVSQQEEVLEDVCKEFAVNIVGEKECKNHGRVAYTLSIGFGECSIDLSFFENQTLTKDKDCATLDLNKPWLKQNLEEARKSLEQYPNWMKQLVTIEQIRKDKDEYENEFPARKLESPLISINTIRLRYNGDYPGYPYIRINDEFLTDEETAFLLKMFGAKSIKEFFDKIGAERTGCGLEHKDWSGEIKIEIKNNEN